MTAAIPACYTVCAEAAIRAARRTKRRPLALVSALKAQADLHTAFAALGPWREEAPPIDDDPDASPSAEELRERTAEERYAAILAALPVPGEWTCMGDLRLAARVGEKIIRRLCDELCERGQLARQEQGRRTYYARVEGA